MGSYPTLTNTYLTKYVAFSEFVTIDETFYPMRHLVALKAEFWYPDDINKKPV